MHPPHIRLVRHHRVDAVDGLALFHEVEAVAGNEAHVFGIVLEQFLDPRVAHEELALLLGGIDLAQTERRKWYRKPPAEEPIESLKTA